MIRRGEIYWVNLDPTIGAEIKKIRPAMVVSNDVNNQHAQTVTVLPLTTATDRVYPFEVPLKGGSYGAPEEAKIKANQIRTVDKRRLGRLIGTAPDGAILQANDALRLHLAL